MWCRVEFPRLQEVLDKYKAQGFAVVTINVMTNQQEGAVKIMADYGFTALKGPDEALSWVYKVYGVHGEPTSFLLDPEGKILFKIHGLEQLEARKTFDAEVRGLLRWAASTGSTPAQGKALQ